MCTLNKKEKKEEEAGIEATVVIGVDWNDSIPLLFLCLFVFLILFYLFVFPPCEGCAG